MSAQVTFTYNTGAELRAHLAALVGQESAKPWADDVEWKLDLMNHQKAIEKIAALFDVPADDLANVVALVRAAVESNERRHDETQGADLQQQLKAIAYALQIDTDASAEYVAEVADQTNKAANHLGTIALMLNYHGDDDPIPGMVQAKLGELTRVQEELRLVLEEKGALADRVESLIRANDALTRGNDRQAEMVRKLTGELSQAQALTSEQSRRLAELGFKNGGQAVPAEASPSGVDARQLPDEPRPELPPSSPEGQPSAAGNEDEEAIAYPETSETTGLRVGESEEIKAPNGKKVILQRTRPHLNPATDLERYSLRTPRDREIAELALLYNGKWKAVVSFYPSPEYETQEEALSWIWARDRYTGGTSPSDQNKRARQDDDAQAKADWEKAEEAFKENEANAFAVEQGFTREEVEGWRQYCEDNGEPEHGSAEEYKRRLDAGLAEREWFQNQEPTAEEGKTKSEPKPGALETWARDGHLAGPLKNMPGVVLVDHEHCAQDYPMYYVEKNGERLGHMIFLGLQSGHSGIGWFSSANGAPGVPSAISGDVGTFKDALEHVLTHVERGLAGKQQPAAAPAETKPASVDRKAQAAAKSRIIVGMYKEGDGRLLFGGVGIQRALQCRYIAVNFLGLSAQQAEDAFFIAAGQTYQEKLEVETEAYAREVAATFKAIDAGAWRPAAETTAGPEDEPQAIAEWKATTEEVTSLEVGDQITAWIAETDTIEAATVDRIWGGGSDRVTVKLGKGGYQVISLGDVRGPWPAAEVPKETAAAASAETEDDWAVPF